MSLPSPVPRRHLHTRTVKCEGFEREDGLFDIEAQIVDQKTYATDEAYRGHRAAGMHVHDMQLRLTLDMSMTVRDIEVTTNHGPYDICPSVAPAYKALIGAKVGGGWRKAVVEAVGRIKGCTHITELLMPAATVAFQTMGSWPKPGQAALKEPPEDSGEKPRFIDGCKAWASDGEVVKRFYPMHFRKQG
jgi:hypothetical protein